MNSNRNGKVQTSKFKAMFSNRKTKSKKRIHPALFNSNEADNNATRSLKQSVYFIDIIGSLLGIKTGYEFKINFRLVCSITLLIFTWIQFFYSQLKYFTNGEYKRILEVFALYGVSVSVIIK